jgi:hypothetical protein
VKDEFYSWKTHPITQIIMDEFKSRIDRINEELIENAGQDARTDAFRSGLIKAYRDTVNVTLEDIE